MSVLLEFAMFSLDGGKSKSKEVSAIINYLKNSGVKYELTPMGTVIETQNLKDALKIVEESYEILGENHDRVYSAIKLDIKKSREEGMKSKIKSVMDKLD